MKNWLASIVLFLLFFAVIAVGAVLVHSSQPTLEPFENRFEQEDVYDKEMKDPSGYLTKEQREAVENGEFERLNEV